jgi:RNA polymerase sigma-70 factor (ECF subfamily)
LDGRYASGVDQRGLEDGELARRIAAAGERIDADAEAELYRRLAPRARLYGLRHLRDRHAAHDLVQQVLLVTLERLRAGEVREPERSAFFVLGMCRMTVLEIRRGTWRRETLLETYAQTEEGVEAPEPLALDAGRLAECLQALAERVDCTIRADEDAVAGRMRVPLAGVKRLDIVRTIEVEGRQVGRWRAEDVPFEPETDEVVTLPSAAALKTMPANTARVQLFAVDEAGERLLGEVTFAHTPS